VHVVAEDFIDLSAELHRLRDDGVAEVIAAPSSPSDPPLLKSRDFH
jgi:hypothetical protein